MRRRLASQSLLLAAALALAACGGRTPDFPEEPQATFTPMDRENLLRREDFLALVGGRVPDAMKNALEIRNYAFGPSKNEELPEVRLEVFNLAEAKDLTFEIRTVFFREDGSAIDATDWVKATAPPRRAYRYRAVAYSKFAVKEQVQIRLLTEQDRPEESRVSVPSVNLAS